MNNREWVLLVFLLFAVIFGLSGIFSREIFDMLAPAWNVFAILTVLFMFASGGDYGKVDDSRNR